MMQLLDLLGPRPVIAVLRAPDATHFAEAVSIVHDAGIDVVEFTMTTLGATEAIARVAADHPDVVVGAGTVRTVRHCADAVDAGARFLVSQILEPAVLDAAAESGVPFVPGSLTPSEIARAWAYGVQAVKVSPIGPVGGLRYFGELRGPLPDIPMIPTGGVEVDEVGSYLAAGAVAVGVSKALFGDALATGDFAGVAERARRVVASADASSALSAGR
jgi:2-dehydro-3-deoxyphosphogluconate aldolase/(4S)-4-hydroxy-2-oxoglutarate aldolase